MYDQQDVDPKKVRPVQMGDILRKYDSWHLVREKLQPSRHRCGRLGTPGGAEALAIFHQLLCYEWKTGSLMEPLARIKVDEKNCSGMIEWQAARGAAARFLPKHTAAAARKHRNLSHVEQEGLPPMPKDRGAEQGDDDGPLAAWLWAWWHRRREEA